MLLPACWSLELEVWIHVGPLLHLAYLLRCRVWSLGFWVLGFG